MNRILLTTFAVGCLGSATVLAQERPNFSGTWVMDMSRSETPAQGSDASPRRPVTLVISQSANEVTIDRRVDGRAEAVTYSFRTPEVTHNPVGTSGANGTSVEGAFAKWTDKGLETLTLVRINGQAVTQTATFALDGTDRMTVETLLVVQHGYESAGGTRQDPNRNVVKDVYRKQQ